MKIELTDDEVTTILVALDNYRDLSNERSYWDSEPEEEQENARAAGWVWQKLFGAQQEFRNSVADAVGEGEPAQQPLPFREGRRIVVDPFDFVGLEPTDG